MAVSSGYGTSVRQGLTGKGVADQDISYDPASGYVKVKGQNFMKPQKLYNGTNFTTQQDFNNAWDAYNKPQPMGAGAGVAAGLSGVPTAGANVGAGMGAARAGGVMGAGLPGAATMGANIGGKPITTPSATGVTQAPQTADTQLNDLIKMLMEQAQNPTPVDVNAIYASPQYAAQQAQAQRGAQQGIRAAQEALGSAGFGRSTTLGERAQGVQNQANEYLQTQVLPQLMEAQRQEKQQQLQNQLAMLGVLTQQQQFGETTAQQRGALTGSFLPPEARQDINTLNALKSTTEQNWMTMTPEQRTSAQAQGDQIRARLQGMGVDPSLFGADVTATTARGNVPRAGVQTQNAREFEQQMAHQEARDKIADDRYVAEFDEDTRRFGLEFALDKAIKNRQLSQDDARIAISRASEARQSASAERSEGQQDLGLLFDIWENTGIAPEGIPGVRAGTPIYEKPTSKQKEASFVGPPVAPKEKPIGAKDSLDNYDYYETELLNAKDMTLAEANKYIEGEKSFLTDSDYKRLKALAKTYFK